MRVFLSWSGEKSRAVAVLLKEWLPSVINSIEPFVSSADIDAGMRWQNEIASQLESTNFGIVCVTRANQESPWLNFEAGALAKAVDSSRVVPLAIDLKTSDVKIPLGQFQAKPATEEGVREIVASLNAASPSPLAEARLDKALTKWWPDLASDLDQLGEPTSGQSSERTERELLEEVLDTVRALARREPLDPVLNDGIANWLDRELFPEHAFANLSILGHDQHMALGEDSERLTADDGRLLRLVAFGMTDQEIAERLSLSRQAVKQRIERLARRYQARNRVHLAAKSAASWPRADDPPTVPD
jgi:DNA-binding CsgD family transcriptional regulator